MKAVVNRSCSQDHVVLFLRAATVRVALFLMQEVDEAVKSFIQAAPFLREVVSPFTSPTFLPPLVTYHRQDKFSSQHRWPDRHDSPRHSCKAVVLHTWDFSRS